MKLFRIFTVAFLVSLISSISFMGVVLAADPTPSPTPDPAAQCASPTEFNGATNVDQYINTQTDNTPADDTLPTEGDPAGTVPAALAPTDQTQASASTTITLADVPPPADPTEGGDPLDGPGATIQKVDLDVLRQNPFFSQDDFDAFVAANHGWYNAGEGMWDFCTFNGMDNFNALVPVNFGLDTFLNKLNYPYDQVVFDNPLDKYSLTGEPCTLFDPRTNLCDETKESVPVTDINGQTILDSTGHAISEMQPKYYNDSIWPNGQWDAPKADVRILKTLDYLVTPVDRGGAGREHIRVSEIIQPNTKNKESLTGTSSLANAPPAPNTDPGATPTPTPTTTPAPSATPEPPAEDSAHAYDLDHPSSPVRIATAMDISEIDNVRITTKIVQKHRIGGNTTSYQYKEVPLKVAWQTDQGVQSADLVGPNMYQAALSSFSTGLAGLLDSMDLSAELDLSSIKDVDSLADVAVLIGQSLLTQILNSPNGSLNGWDLESVLQSIGRAYLASQLGLPATALRDGATADELVQSIGRTAVEKAFSLAQNSLKGNTSAEIFANLGRRQLEDILGVSEDTLLPYAKLSLSDFLERVGAGKIEGRFRLPQGSMQVSGWQKAINTPKTKFMFTKPNASFLDDALGMAFQPQDGKNIDAYGFSESDYAAPSDDFLANPSDAAFAKYKRLVGARAIESGIGRFSAGTTTFNDASTKPEVMNFIKTIQDSFAYHYYNASFFPQIGPNETEIFRGGIPGTPNSWIITINTTSPVRTSGAFTEADLIEIAKQDIIDTSKNTYGKSCVFGVAQFNCQGGGPTQANATTLYNSIQTFWLPKLQTPLNVIEESLREVEADHTDDPTDQALRDARQTVSTALGQVRAYSDGLTIMLQAQGQSGGSAALNLPGSFYQTNPDGTLTGQLLNGGDPINNFLGGDFRSDLMTLIGKAYAAQAMTQDKPAQIKFVSQIKEDLKNFDTLTKYGIDVGTWVSKGFSGDDFDRIFTKNLGPEVFSRIGQQQLLGTLWGKSEFNNFVKDATGSSQVNGILNDITQIAQGLSFYIDRFSQLQAITKIIAAQLDSIANLSPEVKAAFQDLNGVKDLSSIDSVRDKSRQYEPLLQIIADSAVSLKNNVIKAQFILREIAAGQPLNFNQPASGNPIPQKGVINDGCFSPTDFRAFFQNGKNLVNTLASQVAGCRVDDALGLPAGSTYTWYQSKDFSFNSFALAIGKNYARLRGLTLTDDQARAYGKQLLEGMALTKLLGAIPGASSLIKKLGFQGSDIVDILNGRGEQVLERMGGSMMDAYFNWKPGTGSQLLLPKCPDDSGKYVPCNREDATNIRINTLAQIGLQKLGITLNFPTTFDLFPTKGSALGSFDFETNFGIARISESMGLKSNTFYGTFADVRGRNNPGAVLQGIGWYDTPVTRALTKLATSLRALTAGLTASQATAINGIYDQVQQELKDIRNATLDQITKANSPVWVDGQEGAFASTIFSDEQSRYGVAMENIGTIASIAGLDPLTAGKVDNLVTAYTGHAPGALIDYKANVLSFKTRVKGLDGQYGTAPGTFQNFITGSVRAEDIADKAGKRELVNTLASAVLDKLLAGTPFEDLPDTFRVLTKTAACPGGASIADFILNPKGDTPSACTIKSISISQIFSGKDLNDQAKRAFLYDHFLSRAFGEKLEETLHLEPGTIRAIAIQPWRAKEIAVDQGIRLLGAQLFKLTGADSLSTDSSKQMIRALDTALMAGFCPVDPLNIHGDNERGLVQSTKQLCTFNFNASRSMGVLRQSINQLLEERFNQRGGDSDKISLVDLAPIFIGGLNGAYFLGAATLAKQLNEQLGDDPRANAFKIQYADIRNAFGQFTFTAADYKIYEQNAQADFVRDYYNCYDFETALTDPKCLQSNSALIQTYLNDPNVDFTLEDKIDTLFWVADGADKSAPGMMKQRALNNLQYNLYDIIAFKIDPTIPRGFAYAMLQGSNAQKVTALETYLANKLDLGATVFGGLLTNDMVVNLVNYVKAGFKGNVSLDAVNALDGWLGKESEKLFGIALPAGTVQGIFAWGTTGFKGSTFDTAKTFNVGGKLFSPIGTVLKNWGINKLLSWADKSFGWSAGSAYQIYQAASQVIKASNVLKLAHTPFIKALAPGAAKIAGAQLKAAQANLIATVINIVFASQIGDAEQALGLVPGTGSLAVTLLVQLLMGVPVDPITLALFVGINLFGVYAVEITVRATVDGYYPYTGQYKVARTKPLEYPSPDPQTETFDAMAPISYRAGLEHGAQFKVNQLLQDLLRMPDRWIASTGDSVAQTPFVEQVFTARPDDISSLDGLISAPAPWDSPPGWGYGPLTERATILCGSAAAALGKTVAVANSGCAAVPKPSYRAGYFADDSFATHIHIRF